MKAYFIDEDSTILNAMDGRVIFFSNDRFQRKIVKENCCFICGSSQELKVFNNEHIIPRWILKKFNLFDEKITLPNGEKLNYRSYTVPCCKECNSELGLMIEEPISSFFQNSYTDIIKLVDDDNKWYNRLFIWMNLLFFKTHLKDNQLKYHLDNRVSNNKIGDLYDWSTLHHIHCIIRSQHTNAVIQPKVFGTLYIFPANTQEAKDKFDYIDNLAAQTIIIQIGEVCVMAVLNDSSICNIYFQKQFSKINAPLHTIQVRELFSHLAYLNLSLKYRPQYISDIVEGDYVISAQMPEKIDLFTQNELPLTFGELFHYQADKFYDKNYKNREAILEDIKLEKIGFLFDAKGEFIK